MTEIEKELRLAKEICVATKISMSQQTVQQATGIRKEKFVATKEFPVATKIAKDSKKSCRDKVDRLKMKMFVATRKSMSQQIPEADGHEKLVANRFSVATQYIPVATRTRLLHQNYVTTLSKYVSTEFKKVLREQVATEDCMLRQRPTTKTKNSITTKLSMSRYND